MTTIKEILECIPLGVTVNHMGFDVTIRSGYEEGDAELDLHAESENGYYEDFEVFVNELENAEFWEDIITDELERCMEETEESFAMHGCYD